MRARKDWVVLTKTQQKTLLAGELKSSAAKPKNRSLAFLDSELDEI